MSEERFEAVLAAARSGAEWAWTEIYRALSPPVLGYLRARGAPEPEDLLGEVFLHAVRNLSTFEGDEGDLRTWLLTIAHHRLIDDRRYRARRPSLPAPAEELATAGPRGDVEAEALEAAQVDAVVRAIARLGRARREVLLLRLIADLTVKQTARVLGKRPGAVKALQRRALAALDKELRGSE